MAITQKPITSYTVLYSSTPAVRRIWLTSGTEYIGQCLFLADAEQLPADSFTTGQVNLFYHLADFANVLDLLRNERPLVLSWMGPTGENGIFTGLEPVGVGDEPARWASALAARPPPTPDLAGVKVRSAT